MYFKILSYNLGWFDPLPLTSNPPDPCGQTGVIVYQTVEAPIQARVGDAHMEAVGK